MGNSGFGNFVKQGAKAGVKQGTKQIVESATKHIQSVEKSQNIVAKTSGAGAEIWKKVKKKFKEIMEEKYIIPEEDCLKNIYKYPGRATSFDGGIEKFKKDTGRWQSSSSIPNKDVQNGFLSGKPSINQMIDRLKINNGGGNMNINKN